MAFVQLSGICLSFGARDLIKSATLTLMEGSRAALAGPNGAGKSTLMKIAAGLVMPDSGERAITKGARVSYLPQTDVVVGENSVFEEAEKAYGFAADLLRRQEEIGRLLEASTADDDATSRLLEEHAHIQEAVEGSGYWRRRDRVRDVLQGLGFRERDLDRPASEFSGGWQMRVALAKVLLENPDVMLLDEPTNYLDLEARSWLEDFLAKYKGGVLVVSHDRYFLDVTVREVYELWNGRLARYPGTYSQYEERRSRELEAIFLKFADASPLPVILYDIPEFTNLKLATGMVTRLARHGNILGFKDSSADFERFGKLIEALKDYPDFYLLQGKEQYLADSLRLGCSGFVVSLIHLAPASFVALYQAVRSGKTDLADMLQAEVNRAYELVHDTIERRPESSSLFHLLNYAVRSRGVCDNILLSQDGRPPAWLSESARQAVEAFQTKVQSQPG